jgi:cytochrome c biogenesis protein CcdA/thiol-disulfide isomerase/thioredoxin
MKENNDQHPEKNTENSPDNKPAIPGIAAILLAVIIIGGVLVLGAYLLNFIPSAPAPEAQSGSNLTVYFFYGTECPHCHNVTPYVESLRDKYPDVSFRFLEIWHSETNNSFQRLLNHKLGLEATGVPQVIVGNVSLLGEDKIETGLEKAILAQKGNLTGSSQVGAVPVYGSPAGTDTTIHATYFYGNGCSHCEAVKPLLADLEAQYPELRIEMLEINDNKTNRALFLATPIPQGSGSERSIPAIFIGGNALIGETEVKDHFEERILAEKERIASGTPAPLSTPGVPAAGNGSIPAVYFYSDSCSHCEKVKPIIANISARYPDLRLSQLEINHNADNRQLFNEISSRYGIANPGVPTVFIGSGVLIGESEIANQFEPAILAERQRIASGIPANHINMTPVNSGIPPAAPALSPYMVVFAALVDSMNPCGLSVLVFLLISMAAAGNRKRILLVGGTYIAAMFLFHLFVGIGLFSAFALSGLSKPFSIIGGIIALVLGIITLADVLRNRETYLLSIPESGKGLLGTYIRKATLPAAFILGILAGILGFSCTGGIYISILGLMGRDMTIMTGLPWLVLYNIVFVLPLVLVTLFAAYGISPERAERWRTGNKRMVRVIIGIILVALGLLILSGWMG